MHVLILIPDLSSNTLFFKSPIREWSTLYLRRRLFMCYRYSYMICCHAVCRSAGGNNEATQNPKATHWSRLKFKKDRFSFDEPLVYHLLSPTSQFFSLLIINCPSHLQLHANLSLSQKANMYPENHFHGCETAFFWSFSFVGCSEINHMV